jgi:hypothetical protein
VLAGALEQRPHQGGDRLAGSRGCLAREHRQVGHDLVVAGAGSVQAPADRTGDLRQAALDRHVDVLVVGGELKAVLGELRRDRLEAGEQRVAVRLGDDPPGGEHLRVRARLGDVLRPEAPIEGDRGVQVLEVRILRFTEAGQAVQSSHRRRRAAGACDARCHKNSESNMFLLDRGFIPDTLPCKSRLSTMSARMCSRGPTSSYCNST